LEYRGYTLFDSWVLIPFLTSLAVGYGLSTAGMDVESVPMQLLSNTIWLVSIWLGVMYSANYIAKKYVVTDASKIVNLSTIYRIVLVTLFIGGGIFMASGDAVTIDSTAATFQVVFAIVGTVVFYIASKKYIKQDSVGV
jgi:hypothetical protein